MGTCALNAQTSAYLPSHLSASTKDIDTEFFHYDCSTGSLDFKLLSTNPYRAYFHQVYPTTIDEHELSGDMLDVLQSYTDSLTNECYMKTNLNLLSANADAIDWAYVNRLRSLIRGLAPSNLKHVYYRGLTLSDTEIGFYMAKRQDCFYTNSFMSFTIDRLLVYAGNALMILKMETSDQKAKMNLANIWRWSARADEKEALLVVGSKLKVLSVRYLGCKWEIEVELVDDEE
jgi:hypothetical protein